MPITSTTLALSADLRTQVGEPADTATRSHTAAWAASWVTLAALMAAALAAGKAASVLLGHWPHPWEWSRIPAATAALTAAEAELARLTTTVTAAATAATATAVAATLAAEPSIISSQRPPTQRGATLAAVAAAAGTLDLTRRSAASTARIAATTATIPVTTLGALRHALHREPTPATDPLDRLAAAYLTGLDRAITITRTEPVDASRLATQDLHASIPTLISGWTWVCQLDIRCCPACLALHGSTWPTSTPGPADHQCGRCQRVAITPPWSESGITAEPPSALRDARQWFDALPVDDQIAILGPGRHQLMTSGRISWDDLPRRRHTPAWRDSYRPATLTELRQLAADRTR